MNIQATAENCPDPGKVRRVACLMLGEIGDTLVTTPAIDAIRKQYKHATIDVIVRSAMGELLAHNPSVDRVIHYNQKNIITKALFLLKVALGKWDLWVDLHTPTFNTICSNEHVFRRNRLIMRLAGARFRQAYAVDELKDQLTHPVKVPDMETLKSENIVDTTLKVTGCEASRQVSKTCIPGKEDLAWADAMISGYTQHGGVLVVVFFGSKQKAGHWPASNAAELLEALVERYPDIDIFIVGGKHEEEQTQEILSMLSGTATSHVYSLVGQTGLLQLAAIMRAADLVISTDSGPMHIADTTGKPLLSIFSTQAYPAIWKPISKGSVQLFRIVECSHCLSSECSNNNLCTALISANEVFDKAVELLGAA